MLELGCGDNARKRDGYEYHGLDCVQTSVTTVICRAGFEPLPFPDSHFDFILGDQFLEHIPRFAQRYRAIQFPYDQNPNTLESFNPVIELLNEVCRTAKPNAEIQFNVPKWNSVEMQQDPTHCNACPKEMWIYWDINDQWKLKSSYGIIGSLKLESVIDCGWYEIHKLRNIK